jgi:acyl-CoA reductase-like NAD-dependent aldehyde dehydrogenase
MVFFVSEAQKKVIEDALARAQETVQAQTRANQRAAALAAIAERFLGADNPA